ncbi:MAG TPA: DNA mismatch repair endonuclease MutL, partial [Opitutus sp.]|nr:DNA mismatch repair endonuclease MutL [Opitutus sp.]
MHVRDCGRPVGTRIEVTHLFNSVPARRKFLKTDQTEAAHIVQCVRLYALACPRTAFTLIEDGRVIFRSPECATLAERIAEIFGRQTAEALVPLEAVETGMRLSGLIGRPGIGRGTRHEMIVFVNQRPVDSRTLNYALIESYHESIPKGRYPLAFVFFECDPAAVDVNVHPAKREVRFRSEPSVRGFVIRAVLQRLREIGPSSSAVRNDEIRTTNVAVAPPIATAATAPSTSGWTGTPFDGAHNIRPAANPTETPPPREAASMPAVASPVMRQSSPPPTVAVGPAEPVTPNWRFVGLAHGSYALFETSSGLVLLDRRAAHERVWFERLQESFRSGDVPSQR